MKTCSKCKLLLSLDKFNRDSYNPDGFQYRCKSCREEYRKSIAPNERQRVSNWRKGNPDKYRNCHLKRTYGITLEDYNTLLASQNGCCAICKSSQPGGRMKWFCVDHDHKTNKVRALLCGACNQSLGFARESTIILEAMICYLKVHDPIVQMNRAPVYETDNLGLSPSRVSSLILQAD